MDRRGFLFGLPILGFLAPKLVKDAPLRPGGRCGTFDPQGGYLGRGEPQFIDFIDGHNPYANAYITNLEISSDW